MRCKKISYFLFLIIKVFLRYVGIVGSKKTVIAIEDNIDAKRIPKDIVYSNSFRSKHSENVVGIYFIIYFLNFMKDCCFSSPNSLICSDDEGMLFYLVN
jgi:hypothetical protein